MTLRKNNEEVLRKALQNEARQKCAEETRAFGECAKDAGIWVVLSCRKHNLVSHIFPTRLSPFRHKSDYDD